MRRFSLCCRAVVLVFIVGISPLWAQGSSSSSQSGRPAAKRPPKPEPPAPPEKLKERSKFVLDVVEMAVALPQGDPQDRLRVLASAADVAAAVQPKLAKSFAREGAQLEGQIIASGQTPAVSMMQRGHVECSAALDFVDSLPVNAVGSAEQSLLGVLSSCSGQTLDSVKRKLTGAMENGVLAPRALLAAMDATGMKSEWSQAQFDTLFSSLPKDATKFQSEAPNFAAMFAEVAAKVDADAARKAGLNFLEWLGRLPDSNERNLAVNISTDALKQALGEEKYQAALSSNVMAMQVAQTAGQDAEIDAPQEESVSVLQAMGSTGEDRSDVLRELPPLAARPRSRRPWVRHRHGAQAGSGKQVFRYGFRRGR